MSITKSTTYKFEFSNLGKSVPHPVTQGERIAVINSATLTWTEYDEPQESLDGDSVYFDYIFCGRRCKANGTIDKQGVEGRIVFKRHVHTLKFMLALMQDIEDGDVVTGTIIDYLTRDLERAQAREQEQLRKLLS